MKKPKQETREQRRKRLYAEQGGICHWFTKGTPSPGCAARDGVMGEDHTTGKSNAATIDHLYDRYDKRRWQKDGGLVQVLACSGCNNRRSHERNKSLPHALKGRKGREIAGLLP